MSIVRILNLSGLNLKLSPYLHKEGEMIRCVNVENDMIGAKKKRPGYTTYLTSLGQQVTSLFNWTRNDGTTFYNYSLAGGSLFYSSQGTGAWTICGNGTFTSGANLGYTVLEDTMVVGDGTLATRHSTDGTSFTNTVAAPIANYFESYQDRIYAGGTSSNLFYSTTGSATDWTSDSNSIAIPGPGRINGLFKNQDRLITPKNSGDMFRWDGYSLADLVTNLGPVTPSIPQVEDFHFLLNRQGVCSFSGVSPQLISNHVERQIFNDKGSGIIGTVFPTIPGIAYQYDVLYSVGTVTDNLTDNTINGLVLKYDYQLDEWSNWQFANIPTAFGTYTDQTGARQLIFGDSTGQCYTFGGTALTDNGVAIESTMEGVLNFGAPEMPKQFNYVWAFANPGCEAHIQVALGKSFTKATKKWIPLGDFNDGIAEKRLGGAEGNLLFWKITESSMVDRYQFYGFAVDVDGIDSRK